MNFKYYKLILFGMAMAFQNCEVNQSMKKSPIFMSASDIKWVSQFTKREIEDSVIGANIKTVYYYDDMIMYEYPLITSFISTNSSGNEKLDSVRLYHGYIVYYKNDLKNGIRFNPNNSSGKIESVDSFLNSNTDLNFEKFYESTAGNDSLVYENIKKNSMTKEYVSKKGSWDMSYKRAIYFYRRDFNDIEFSFSNMLDKSAGMKLYKVVLVFTDLEKTISNKTFRDTFEILRRNKIDTAKIFGIFEKFKVQYRQLKS